MVSIFGQTSRHQLDCKRTTTTSPTCFGLAAVVAATQPAPKQPGTRGWEYTHNELMRCVRKQVLDDGCCFERSTRYTRLMGEMLFFAGKCFAETPYKLPAEYFERLSILGRFLDAVTNKDGRSLQVGDNDSGRVVCISPERYDDLRLVSRLVDREIGPDAPDEAFFAEEELFYGASGPCCHVFLMARRARTFYDAGMLLLGMETGRWDSSLLMALSMSPSLDIRITISFPSRLASRACRFLWTPVLVFIRAIPRCAISFAVPHNTRRCGLGILSKMNSEGCLGYMRCGGASLDVAEADGTVVFRGATDCWARVLA